MSFDYFSKSRMQYILTKLKVILDAKAVPADIKNGTLTIQKNGTNVQTFSANQSSNATANITVPTKTSDLTNDSGFTTNTGTVTSVSAGIGLAGGPVTGSGSLKAKLKSETKLTNDSTAATETTGRIYPIVQDKTGYLAVVVPWENTHTITGVKGNAESSYRTGNVNITPANIGLGNVGNFKAVSTVASQGLTDTEKSNARANIGAGTSNFSGAYADLSGKPTIPTVNNGTLTIQKNGTNVQTFTANQSGNATANITVPTKVSELSNDSGFTTNVGTITGINMNGTSKGTSGVVDLGTVITAHQDISGKANTADLGDGAYKNSGVYYGTCATAAATKDKVVSVSADQKFTLKVGAVVHVKFTNTNSYSATADNKITLNVNSTGAKNIYYGTGYSTGTNTVAFGAANYIMSYMYNGTDWVWVGFSAENNTTYSAMSSSELTTGTATTSRTVRADYLKTGINSLIDTKINALDVTGASGIAASKTISAWSETDGKVSLTTQDISITKSQVSDFPTSMTPTSHTHGNIQNGGTLQTNDITIASGDKLVVTDSSDSNKVARTSIAFDGSTATKALTQKGTWESFTNNAGTITGIKMNGASKGTSGVVDLGTVLTAHQDISGKADKSATVSTVAWDSTNKKITKTINGTTTDVVSAATILGNLTSAQVTTALGYTPPTSDTKNTAGSTDTSSKIFLIGATSQAANPQTYSDDQVYTTNGTLTSNKLSTKALVALTGSGTAGSDTGASSNPRTYTPTLWTFNSGVTVANGEVYFIKIPETGGTYGVWLSLNNGTNYYPVAINSGKGRFTTHYAKNTVIAVTYESAGVCTCYPKAGGTATSDVTGCFRVLNDYDSGNTNTNVTQTATSTNANYEVLFSATADNTTRTEGARKYSNLKFNPSTGNLQTTQLNGVTIGSSPKFTDTNVTQTPDDSTNSNYELLFSNSANNTSETNQVRKSSGLIYNPSSRELTLTSGSNNTHGLKLIESPVDASKANNNVDSVRTYTLPEFKDSSGRIVGGVKSSASSSGSISTSIFAENYDTSGGNISTGGLSIYANKDGTISYNVSDDAAFCNAIGNPETKVTQTPSDSSNADYEILFSNSANNNSETAGVKKSSGLVFNPVTNSLTKKNSSIDVTKTNNNVSEHLWQQLNFSDKNYRSFGTFAAAANPTGFTEAAIIAKNYDTSGNVVSNNYITVDAYKDGTTDYHVSNPSAFRSAIEIKRQSISWTPTYKDSDGNTLSGVTANYYDLIQIIQDYCYHIDWFGTIKLKANKSTYIGNLPKTPAYATFCPIYSSERQNIRGVYISGNKVIVEHAYTTDVSKTIGFSADFYI